MGMGRFLSVLHIIKFDFFKMKYAKQNKNNSTLPGNYFSIDKVFVGDYTYGTLNVVDHSDDDSVLRIGSYCSIASGVQFVLGGEHMVHSITTFPFKVIKWGEKREALSKGNIVVGNDVWIGQNAMIMSGVTVGQGAIIGAGAVVTKNVKPYSIVGGVPAKELGFRFSEKLVNELMSIDIDELFSSLKREDVELVYSENEEDILTLVNRYKKHSDA